MITFRRFRNATFIADSVPLSKLVSADLEALVIKQYQENCLIDRGRVGSGISTKTFGNLLSLLCPLAEKNGITWVDPSLQVEVSYFEETEGAISASPFPSLLSSKVQTEVMLVLKIALIMFFFWCRNTPNGK